MCYAALPSLRHVLRSLAYQAKLALPPEPLGGATEGRGGGSAPEEAWGGGVGQGKGSEATPPPVGLTHPLPPADALRHEVEVAR